MSSGEKQGHLRLVLVVLDAWAAYVPRTFVLIRALALLPSLTRGRMVAADWPAEHDAEYYPSLAEALQSHCCGADGEEDENAAGINGVWISTPTDTHEAEISIAAAAGVPIFTEKPVAADPASIARVFALCRDHGVPLCCGFQRRFDETYPRRRVPGAPWRHW